MDLKLVKLNIYSFGYATGFLSAGLKSTDSGYMSLDELVKVSKKFNLGGIEFPFDYFFKNNFEKGLQFLDSYKEKVYLDFEHFDPKSLSVLIPQLRERGFSSVRIKMNHLGPVFYGGNRYGSPTFNSAVVQFILELKEILPVLKDYKFKLLIENHQDLSSVDLLRIINEVSPEFIGINWDIGNSLAVGDTIESFFSRLDHSIGNVHLKDYKVASFSKGFKLIRCPIGQGVVDFKWVFSELAKRNLLDCSSIELGAHISRECDINIPDYWETIGDSAPMNVIDFKNKVDSLSIPFEVGTLYEQNESREKIVKGEMAEVEQSVQFLERL